MTLPNSCAFACLSGCSTMASKKMRIVSAVLQTTMSEIARIHTGIKEDMPTHHRLHTWTLTTMLALIFEKVYC